MKYIKLTDLDNEMSVFDEKDNLCNLCSYPLNERGQCLSCNIFRSKNNISFTGGKFHFEKIFSCGKYKYMKGLGKPTKQSEDNLSWLILNYKNSDKLLSYCGDLITMNIHKFIGNIKLDKKSIILCCVADSDMDKYKKGELLAENISKKTEISFLKAIKRIKEIEKQHKFKGENLIKKKFENVKNAFTIDSEIVAQLAGKTIFLIDDVVSSMASVNECARILKEVGAKEVYVFSLGRNILPLREVKK